jgi:SAM-dependent methyltransferase
LKGIEQKFKDNYWKHRWASYLKQVYEFTLKLNIATPILEIGCNGIPLFENSHTVDKKSLDNYPTFKFNITKQWPLKDKSYDLVIACQVWEHLKGEQLIAFRELKRVCKTAIFTFPYLWIKKWKENTPWHLHITQDQINEWTENTQFEEQRILPSPVEKFHRKRLFRYYNFENINESNT